MGFSLLNEDTYVVHKPSHIFFVSIPLWFPTLLLAALTWWTWRKARAKDGRGFAVDSAEAKAVDR